MRRAVNEWMLVFSIVLLVAVGLIWVASLFLQALREPLALGSHVYARVDESRLCLFNELGEGWKPNLQGVDRKAISWTLRYTTWMYPGLEYHNRLFANGRTIWSVEVSLIIPVVFLLISIAILWRMRCGNWLGRSRAAP
jgi:hypothetical protein